MKKITYLVFGLIASQMSIAQNDCASALTANAGTHVIDAIDGTQPSTPVCGGSGAATLAEWFAYTPTSNYTVTVTSDLAINACKDTRFHVYSGTCGVLTCVGGDDDSGEITCPNNNNTYLSKDTFNVTAGTTYYIVFDNRWSAAGLTFQIIEEPLVVPPTSFSPQNIATVIGNNYNICIVDMNNDHKDDLVGVSESNIRINYQNTNGTFTSTDIATETAQFLPTWSLAAGDYNKDGFNDLLYGAGNGITFMKSNTGGTSYTNYTPGQYVFCQRTNFVDLNNDGNLDAFSCHDVDPNVYYLNDSLGNLTYYQSGTTPGAAFMGIHPEGGNYGSIFVDYDNDGDQDLFIAKCRGGNGTAKINELHKNTSYTDGNGVKIVQFEDVSIAANMADPIQTWSSAWADYDNDGDMDAMVGASSTADGTHKLMRNNGDGTFTNITAGSGWDTNASLNIEHIAHDFDNDGLVDIMGGGNKIMFNQGNMVFAPSAVSFSVGSVGDINNDGFLDVQNGATVYKNNGNGNHWLKIAFQGIQSNSNGIGARVEIYGAWGKQIRDVRSGDGFKYMSSLNAHFGIGTATTITQVIIRWPSGIVDTYNNITPDQMLVVVEGATLSNEQFNSTAFSLYPNPAQNEINIHTTNSDLLFESFKIFDLNGKMILETSNLNAPINVSNLATGQYILLASDNNGKNYSRKFLKK